MAIAIKTYFALVFIFVTLILFVAGSSHALPCGGPQSFTATIKFTPAPQVEGVTVTGYRLYFGNSSKNYTNSVDLGFAQSDNDGKVQIPDGMFDLTKNWYFAVTAYGPSGESELSNEQVVLATTTGSCPPPLTPQLEEIIQLLQNANESISRATGLLADIKDEQ